MEKGCDHCKKRLDGAERFEVGGVVATLCPICWRSLAWSVTREYAAAVRSGSGEALATVHRATLKLLRSRVS